MSETASGTNRRWHGKLRMIVHRNEYGENCGLLAQPCHLTEPWWNKSYARLLVEGDRGQWEPPLLLQRPPLRNDQLKKTSATKFIAKSTPFFKLFQIQHHNNTI